MSAKSAILHPLKIAVMSAAQAATSKSLTVKGVACKQGCYACCQRYLMISVAEAMLVVEYAKSNGKWEKMKKSAEDQRNLALEVKPAVWFKLGIECPVLSNGKCMAYPVRPLACSSHFVASPPEACSTDSTSMARYRPIMMPDVQIKFAEEFDKIIGMRSILRARAPISIALMVAEKVSIGVNMDFDETVSAIARKFGHGM